MFASWVAGLSAVAAVLFAAFYYYFTLHFNYWKDRNVPHTKPSLYELLKGFVKIITGKTTIQELMDETYYKFKENGFGGIFQGRQPMLVVCKPELIKYFLTKDFSSFHDRGPPPDVSNDPFSANLFNLDGQRWKVLRSKLSPTFTSGRIKGMFPLIEECSQELKEYLDEEIKKDDSIDMKDLLIRYTTDVIGSCAFGINCNSIKNPHAEFHVMSREIFKTFSGIRQFLLMVVLVLFSKLQKILTTKRLLSKLTTFFMELMDRTVKYRKENNVDRNDFVQLMMKIMEEEQGELIFNQEIMTAQAFLFFLAGLDNVATTIGFCLHALAVDQELQERVHHEISTVLEEFDGKMSYEALNKMDLIAGVIDEALRLYSPAGGLVRKQTDAKYIIPGTNIEIDKGTLLLIPSQSIHHDEEIFPNPKKFDPDRFTEEEKAKRHPYAYLPFGEGPRICIAARFAKLEMKLCLVELIRHFSFSAGSKTDIVMELKPLSLTPTPKNNFWLRVTVR